MACPGTRDHHAAGPDDAFLERADDGLVDGMAHPEIVGVDKQQAGICGVSQEVIRWAGIPCAHLTIPFQKVLSPDPDTVQFRLIACCFDIQEKPI
jgi:hypothetical protein